MIEKISKYHLKRWKNLFDMCIKVTYISENSNHLLYDIWSYQSNLLRKNIDESMAKAGTKDFIISIRDKSNSEKLFSFPELVLTNIKLFNNIYFEISSEMLFPGGKYATEKELEFRMASSFSHFFEDKTVIVHWGSLLNTKNGFIENFIFRASSIPSP